MEDYLKAIYVLEGEDGERVATSELAEHLSVTPPTVSSMMEKLAERGLVDREEYKGVRLTDEGEVVALEILRHHRLLESFLTQHLDYEWTDVHEEADRLEHHISDEFGRRIAEVLDNPGVDPHGDPIPDADLRLPEDAETTRLDEASVDDHVVVQRVRHRTDDELQYLAEVGIEPGAELTVVDVAPIGMVTVDAGGTEQSLPEDVARTIEVRAASAVESS
jgi:DtxR family Mn-dependent transcriptional regulator